MLFYMKIFKISTVVIPAMPTTVSIIVQVRNVCFIERLKYSLKIQNPESLKCDNTMLPAPVARTISSGEVPVLCATGSIKGAVVSAATVAEPTVIRKTAATMNAIKSGLTGITIANDLMNSVV